MSWNVIVQIFTDDISAAIGHLDRAEALKLSHALIKALLRQLANTDLEVSPPKVKNFFGGGTAVGHPDGAG